jgi:hypothetical protein
MKPAMATNALMASREPYLGSVAVAVG